MFIEFIGFIGLIGLIGFIGFRVRIILFGVRSGEAIAICQVLVVPR